MYRVFVRGKDELWRLAVLTAFAGRSKAEEVARDVRNTLRAPFDPIGRVMLLVEVFELGAFPMPLAVETERWLLGAAKAPEIMEDAVYE